MQHTFYAVFDDSKRALDVVAELERQRCAVSVHRGVLEGDRLEVNETSTRTGVATGGLVGGALGAVVGGLVVGPVGAGLGAVAGTVYGGTMGAIVGAHAPEHNLEELTRELGAGRTLLAVEAAGMTGEESAEAIVRRGGGRVVERRVV